MDDGSWRLLSETESITGENSESGPSLDAFKSPKQGKHPITPDQREKVQELLTTMKSDEAQLLVNIEMTTRKMNQLIKEKNNTKNDKDKTQKLKEQIAFTKEEIKNDEKFYKETSILINLSNDLLEGKVKNHEKAFAALETNPGSTEAFNSGMGGINTIAISEKSSAEDKKSARVINYPTTFPIEKAREKEDTYECEIVFDGYDEEIGSNRKEVKTQPFFSYSQEKMKPYFKADDYLHCDASISKVGKKYYLTLKIRIRSKDANKTYGALRANENIKIHMIDGRSVYGEAINSDKGQIESYTGHTLYTGIFQLDKGDINDLKNNYLDHIGIIWSSGYEQYDIYNVDFLKNQIQCLNK